MADVRVITEPLTKWVETTVDEVTNVSLDLSLDEADVVMSILGSFQAVGVPYDIFKALNRKLYDKCRYGSYEVVHLPNDPYKVRKRY